MKVTRMLNPSDREWGEFVLCGNELSFSNYHGKRLIKRDRKSGITPLLTAGESYQGVADFISNDWPKYQKSISIDMFGNTFYHDFDCSGDDNIYFFCNQTLSKNVKLFITNCIQVANKGKFSYGKQFRQPDADKIKIKLPITNNGNPDFVFMESFINEFIEQKKVEYQNYAKKELFELGEMCDIPLLESKQWKEFHVGDIFIIKPGKRLESYNMTPGTRPFIGAVDSNNGITKFVSNLNNSADKNVLGVNYNGGVVINFYHPYECIFTDDVKRFHLKNCKDDKFILLFIKTVILQQKLKYSYGYKFNEARMARQKIILPIDENDQPDYLFMKQYIKNIMITKYKKYLEFNH